MVINNEGNEEDGEVTIVDSISSSNSNNNSNSDKNKPNNKNKHESELLSLSFSFQLLRFLVARHSIIFVNFVAIMEVGASVPF